MNRFTPRNTRLASILLGLILPLLLAVAAWTADYIQGPDIVIAGGIIGVPILSSIFSGPRQTALVGGLVLLGSVGFGLTTQESGTPTGNFRLIFYALVAALCVVYSAVRTRKERERETLIYEVLRLGQTSELAFLDQLTGLNNRRGVLEALKTLEQWPRTVALFDVDKLKAINDNFGHQIGDEFIAAVSGRLKSAIAASDIIGRWGGDEFIVIIPLPAAEVQGIAERVLKQIGSAPFGTSNSRIEPRVSCGFAEWKPTQTLEHTIALADAALYKAKALGGHQAVMDLTLLEA